MDRVLTLSEARHRGCQTTPAQRCALMNGSIVVWDEAGNAVSAAHMAGNGAFQWATAPDGRHIIGGFCAGNMDEVRVWETGTGRLAHSYVFQDVPLGPQLLRSWAVTPDGRRLVMSRGHHMRVWDLKTRAPLGDAWAERAIRCLAAANEVICAGHPSGALSVFELPSRGDEVCRGSCEPAVLEPERLLVTAYEG
jgi:hypothetical protein